MNGGTGTPPLRRAHRLDIQGLRGVSVLLVVLFHAGLGFPGGFIGVDVFFVISGVVIGQGLAAEARASGRISLRKFYVRRVRRLLPALAAMLTVVGIACVGILSPFFPQQVALRTARAAGLSVSNLYLWKEGGGYFAPGDDRNPFVHTWSLGVEEQFYLFFPAIVAVAWIFGRRVLRSGERGLRLTLVVISLASFVACVLFTFGAAGTEVIPKVERFAFYGPVTRVWEFAVGVLLVVLLPHGVRRLTSVFAGAGLLLIIAASVGFSGSTPFPGWAVLVPVVGAVLVLACQRGAVSRALAWPPLVWLGDRSYSWYLWHWPFIVLAEFAFGHPHVVAPLAALSSLAPAMFSYRYIEQRFRVRRGIKPVWRTTGLVMASVLVPLLVLTAALKGSDRNWSLERPAELGIGSLSQNAACWSAATPVENCTFGDGERGTILLVGDSHADSASDAVVAAAKAVGYRVIVQSALKCPFVTTPLELGDECDQRQRSSMTLIEQLQPDIVVIANKPEIAVDVIGGVDGSMTEYEPRPAQAVSEWGRVVDQTFDDLEPHTSQIVWLADTPFFTGLSFDRSLPSLLHPDGLEERVPLSDIQRVRAPILVAETAAANRHAAVRIVDPIAALCPTGRCGIRDDAGRYLFHDDNHMTPFGSLHLTDDFAEVFAEARSV